MKVKFHPSGEISTKFKSQQEYGKRNYRLEKEQKESISSACLRWGVERRYL